MTEQPDQFLDLHRAGQTAANQVHEGDFDQGSAGLDEVLLAAEAIDTSTFGPNEQYEHGVLLAATKRNLGDAAVRAALYGEPSEGDHELWDLADTFYTSAEAQFDAVPTDWLSEYQKARIKTEKGTTQSYAARKEAAQVQVDPRFSGMSDAEKRDRVGLKFIKAHATLLEGNSSYALTSNAVSAAYTSRAIVPGKQGKQDAKGWINAAEAAANGEHLSPEARDSKDLKSARRLLAARVRRWLPGVPRLPNRNKAQQHTTHWRTV